MAWVEHSISLPGKIRTTADKPVEPEPLDNVRPDAAIRTNAGTKNTIGSLSTYSLAMFIINHDQISAEVFENEIVAIHFLKGTYFSLRGASLALWSWLQPGADEATLVRLLAARYSLDTSRSGEAVAKALTALRQSELIIDSDRPMPPDDAYDLATGPGQYEEAVVECFEDLQELIAIDPVHEVDPMQGWPHRPPSITLD